jgi:hypothetical protein
LTRTDSLLANWCGLAVNNKTYIKKIMALPCPQRDALEAVEPHTTPWPVDQVSRLTSKTTFRLASGETIHLLGVSKGTGMRDDPNLHIAVFSDKPRTRALQHANWLQECQFGGLITGPDDDGQLCAEGLAFEGMHDNVVILRKTGHRCRYRPI